MPVQKIKSGRVLNPPVALFVGEKGMLFYDEDIPQLRLSDGHTPGGIVFPTGGGAYILPTASTSTLGGIKIGTGLSIDGAGVVSAIATSTYILTTASNTVLGGIKVGSGLSITPDGTVSAIATSTYILTTATNIALGGIKVGANLSITADGTLNANTSTAGISDSFKTFKVSGNSDLVATGADILAFVAGSGIFINTDSTATPYKTMTIASSVSTNVDGGSPSSAYGGLPVLDGGFA
jgi:hypothetical protein